MKEYLKKISLVLATCTFLFSCDKFLEENPKDKLPEDDVYNSISEVYLNAVASLYTYVGLSLIHISLYIGRYGTYCRFSAL